MFPSTILSTGGDEVNANCYEKDAETQADLKAAGRTIEQALDVFTQKTHGAIISEGKTPAVWEEMVLDHNITLSNNTIVLYADLSVSLLHYTDALLIDRVWISSANAAAVAKKNFRLVHGPSDYFYLVCVEHWISSPSF